MRSLHSLKPMNSPSLRCMMIETLKTLEFTRFILSFKLALITTLILFAAALPLAWYLSQTRSKMKPFWRRLPHCLLSCPLRSWGSTYSGPCLRIRLWGLFLKRRSGCSLLFLSPGLWWRAVSTLCPSWYSPCRADLNLSTDICWKLHMFRVKVK